MSEDATFTPPKVNGVKADQQLDLEVQTKLPLKEKQPKDPKKSTTSPSAFIKIADYTPEVTPEGAWCLSEVDLEFVATGANILACGGGGPGYITYLSARDTLRQGKKIYVVDVNSLPDDCLVFATNTYG